MVRVSSASTVARVLYIREKNAAVMKLKIKASSIVCVSRFLWEDYENTNTAYIFGFNMGKSKIENRKTEN